MHGRRMTRRKFFFLAAGLTAAGATGSWFARKPVRLGLVGAGSHGRSLASKVAFSWWYGGLHGEIVALCDVDRRHALAVQAACCSDAEVYEDYRRLLERDDLEGVIIATPDHWHALVALEAMRAGKAVYCEKPISLTIAEGQALVSTAQRTGCVFLGGTMQRNDRRFRTACELVRNGRLGRLHQVTVTLPQRWRGDSAGPFRASAPPAELNWDLWLGQAPVVPYCKERCHGSFRRWYEYSGGQLTDWGAHHLDIVHWALDMEAGGPVTIHGTGELPSVPNGYNTPLDFTVDLLYPNDVRVHIRADPAFENNGIRFEGERGWIFVSRDRLEGSAVAELERRPLPSDALRLHPSIAAMTRTVPAHLQHFFRCIRHGEPPVSDVVSQHRSASACHLANISLRLGRELAWDPAREEFIGDREADAMRDRRRREAYRLPAEGGIGLTS
jgi:myo-inositol 2-dehydrogenase/D-chiro-inositol 1-dehydrogenase